MPQLQEYSFTILLGSVSLILPFGRDQGIHAFIADSVLHGAVPYKDIYNIKPPMTTVVHAAALLLFGHSMTSIRILDLILTILISLGIFAFTVKAFKQPWMALFAALLFPYQYFQVDFWNTAKPTDGLPCR